MGYDGSYKIQCVFLVQVTLVGIVYEKAERNTDVNFVLDDGTGRITCRRWYIVHAKWHVDGFRLISEKFLNMCFGKYTDFNFGCVIRINESFDTKEMEEVM
jgi:hypothetical protein